MAGKDYDVGYGKPPKHTRWVKGQSGNRAGRKKGSRGLKTDLDEALRAQLTITVAGKKRKGTTQALSMYALAMKAATGDLRASKLLADLVMTVFGSGERSGEEARLSQHDQAMLDRFLGVIGDEREEGGPDADTGESDVNGEKADG